MMNKEVRKLINSISGIDGVEVVNGGKHLRVLLHGKFVTILPTTPGDSRWKENAVAELRRQGITPSTDTRAKKESVVRPLMAVDEIRARVAAICETRASRYAFARFAMGVAEVSGFDPPYRNERSAAGSLALFIKREGSLRYKTRVVLDQAIRQWDRTNMGQYVQKTFSTSARAEPEAVVPQELTSSPEDAQIVLKVNLAQVSAFLGQFGIKMEVVP